MRLYKQSFCLSQSLRKNEAKHYNEQGMCLRRNIAFGDIVSGAGGMTAFMNQIMMMDHGADPRITSEDFKNNLPRKYAFCTF